MGLNKFIGREEELARLKGLKNKKSASLIVVRGRRRIGKSRLLVEFGQEMQSFIFSGNPPGKNTTAETQRKLFSQQLARAGIPGVKSDNWGDLFWHLSKHAQKGKILIVLDEISWMGGKDPQFLGHLKTAWDLYFSKNPQLIMALCGSVSSWIEKNILSSTGFLGRIILDLVLEELPIKSCNAFWGTAKDRISPYEKFKILSVTGGVPHYLEQIRQDLTAEQNIQELCFKKGGLLVQEFDKIFSDIFSTAKTKHKDVINLLAGGPKSLSEICEKLGKKEGGIFTNYLNELVESGFVKRDFTWNLKTEKEGKLSRYRLSDNYLRFFLKYVAPNRSKIEKGGYSIRSLTALSGWQTIMGLQFENLVVHNRQELWKILRILPEELVMDGPFFQNSTTKQSGCQIDYLIQTRFHVLYLCEIKFSKSPIGKKIVREMQEKIERLKVPRFCSIRPVLIHVNGVDESVLEEDFFDKIVDFGLLLNRKSS